MSRHNSGTFKELQNINLPGIGGMKFPDAIQASLVDVENGADFEKSWLYEVESIFNSALDDGRQYRPAGDHLAGRNIESELLAGKEKLVAIKDDEAQELTLRAAMIPEIVKIELQLEHREFMKTIRDPEWGADIGELVARVAPHTIFNYMSVLDETTGKSVSLVVPQTVSIKLETLELEYDDYGEVCCWIYEESSRDL